MTSDELANLHGLVDVLTVASSLSVMAAIGWYLLRMRGRVGGLAGATALTAVFVLALSATRIGGFIVARIPGADAAYLLEAFAAGVMVVAAVAVWPLVPKLLSMPTRCELVEANRRLIDEQEARRRLVREMRELNEDLERRVAERTRDLDLERRRFEIALAGTAIAVAAQDRDLRYTWMYNAPAALGGVDPVGRLPEEVLPASTAVAQATVKRRVLETGEAERFEVAMPGPDGTVWYEGRVEPLVEGGDVVGVMTMSIDITRHKDHEREMRALLRELTHRSKNLLAVVQGIARQSALGSPAATSFLRPFNGRLQALSRVHEILVEETWRGVGLRGLIERERVADGGQGFAPLDAALPERRLSPEAAQSFALAIHELFADARAATPQSGPLAIGWREEGDRFVFEWRRAGAPSGVLETGFGRLFLERHMPRSVAGEATLSIEPEATGYRLVAPLSALDPS